MADIFISHSGRDNEVAAAIGERIRRERPSWSLFYDRDNIRVGQRWQERLREELTSCRVVLALLSRNWLGSPWCFTEAVTATFRGKDVGKHTDRSPLRARENFRRNFSGCADKARTRRGRAPTKWLECWHCWAMND